MQTVTVHGEPVDRSSLVKGYQFAKNQYVLIDKDELDALRLESTKVIDIEQFVDVATSIACTGTSPTIWRRRARPASRPLP
jgi:DNA end-binding protein Ku